MKSFSQLFLTAQDCSNITDSDLHDVVNPKSDRFLPDSNGIYTIYYGFDLEYKLDGFEDKTVTISRNYDEFVY